MQMQLQQSLLGHNKDVRCLDIRGDWMVTGSFDGSVMFWSRQGHHWVEHNRVQGIWEDKVYSVAINGTGTKVAVGCRDNHIYILDREGNPVGLMEGHSGIVSSLEWTTLSGQEVLLSGSWDGRCIMWINDTIHRQWDCHRHAVTIKALSTPGLVATASQDGAINLIDLSSGQIIHRKDNAHSDIIRGIVQTHLGLVSVSNDETIKTFTMDLQQIHEVQQCSGFIFAVESNGDLVMTGGDDCTLRIYRGSNKEAEIQQNGVVWALKQDGQGGVACGLSDGSVRIFGCTPELWLPEQDRYAYQQESQLQQNKQPGQQLSQDQVKQLPFEEQRNQHPGKKQGEIKMFKTKDHRIMAYSWDMSSGWQVVGEVTGQNQGGATAGPKQYHGDQWFPQGQYDFIFDIELDSGTTQLPFNRGDNPLTAAERFLVREQLPKTYTQQIIQFIQQHTAPAPSAPSAPAPSQNKPHQSMSSQSRHFPLGGYVSFGGVNKDGLYKKVLEFNSLLRTDNPAISLSDNELTHLSNILSFVSDVSARQKDQLSTLEMEVLCKCLLWPQDKSVPIIDLLRVFLTHHQSERLFSGVDSGLNLILKMTGMLSDPSSPDGVRTLLIKTMCNLCHSTQSKNSLFRFHEPILQSVSLWHAQVTAPAFRNALSSLLFNYSIAYQEVATNLYDPPHLNQYLSLLLDILRLEPTNTHIYRYGISLGNVLLRFKPMFSHQTLEQARQVLTNKQLQFDGEHDQVKSCLQDLLAML